MCLGGDTDSCDQSIELLVSKHPEIKVVKIGDLNFSELINITDRGLQILLTADGLTEVSLCNAHLITGETLKIGSNFAQYIQDLALMDCSLTDKGLLKILDSCGIQLTSLDVSESNITGEGFIVFQDKFTNMEKLNVMLCEQLTKQGLLEILMMCGSKLKNLNISATNITDLGLELQGKFAELKTLNLSNCSSLTDQGLLKMLSMCGIKLQHLDFSDTNVTGQGLGEFQNKFADLQALNLCDCPQLTNQGLLEILSMCGTKLQDLEVMRTNITGQGLGKLQGKFANLKKLELKFCPSLTDQGLLEVLRMCGIKVQDLDIGSTNITGQGLEELQKKLADLKKLSLTYCHSLTDEGLLDVLKMCGTKLQDMDISETFITGQGLVELQGKFADLKKLTLNNCPRLTDQGLSEIISTSGHLLKTVHLCRTNISPEVKNRMQFNRPNLTIL